MRELRAFAGAQRRNRCALEADGAVTAWTCAALAIEQLEDFGMAQKPIEFGRAVSLPRASTPVGSDNGRPPRRLAGGKLVSTVSLGTGSCRWPTGDPSEAEFH